MTTTTAEIIKSKTFMSKTAAGHQENLIATMN